MIFNYSLFCLFGILSCCFIDIVAHEAIVGGMKAASLEYRYQATILIPGHEPRCGGGIIGENFAITAAHCVIAGNAELISGNIAVLVGTHDLNVAGVVVDVEKVYIPEEYDAHRLPPIGDIAVLKLKKPLEIKENNLKVLYLGSRLRTHFYENKTTTITGFGWDKIIENNEMIGEHTDDRLRFATANVLSQIQCKYDHPNRNITVKHLCARVQQDDHDNRRHGVCIGDGGGPLVLTGQTVIGILSVTTIGCSEKTSSGIYIRVAHYRNYIAKIMDNRKPLEMRVLDV